MKAVIIDFKPLFSNIDQTIFFKKALGRCKEEITDESVVIEKYNVPVCSQKPSEKAIKKFCQFLKAEGVSFVYVTDAVKQMDSVFREFVKNFSFFTGEKVINYKACDIIRKYAGAQNLMMAESTLSIETDNPEKAKNLILKIHRQVKKIKIKTKKPDVFLELCDFFLKEYGLYIALNEKNDEKEIFVELDSLLPASPYLNLSADMERATQIIFKCKESFQKLKEFSVLNQRYLEFLTYCEFGQLNGNTVKQFFNKHSVKISKIL